MATWTSFYINTDNSGIVTQKLRTLADIPVALSSSFPADIHKYYLSNENAFPTYLAIGGTQPGWTTVVHNSFNKLGDWALILSKELETKVIVTGAQSVSSYYYFALYENGKKLRELEFCYSDDFEPVNFGTRLWFEDEQPGTKDEYEGVVEYYFGFEDIENYCNQFGLTIQVNYSDYQWTVLKKETNQQTVEDVVREILNKKPWWKFW